MSAWATALRLAEATPASRNRYVDLLRAVSIGAVVFGHWLIAAPWIGPDGLRLDHMLAVQPWTRWLTLGFQVMPIFFLVGGYSNAASWDGAVRRGTSYADWVVGRMRRLIGPAVPLLVFWGLLAPVMRGLGVGPVMLQEGSRLALVPLWFLAVYSLVVLLVPLTRAAWRRLGIASYWLPVAAAVVVDVLRFHDGHRPGVGWINYLFVWVAMHQLGYLWRDGRLAGARAVPWLVGGALAWAGLARFGPYPISMVGVPGEPVSNTLPPDIMLLALGAAQTGLLLALENPARRLLARTRVWAATVLVNGTIMSVYLWHLTALSLLIGLAYLLGGVGLRLEPGSTAWWATRPPALVVYGLGLLVLMALFGRFERLPNPDGTSRPSAWRIVPGALLVCGGLALLALGGIADAGGVNVPGLALALVGAVLARAVPLGRGL